MDTNNTSTATPADTKTITTVTVTLNSRGVAEAVVHTLHAFKQIFTVTATAGSKKKKLDKYNSHPFTTASLKSMNQNFNAWTGKTMMTAKKFVVTIYNPSSRTKTYCDQLNLAMNILGPNLGDK